MEWAQGPAQEFRNVALSLRNKIVFVTGASSGIGAATALEFARLGAKLLLCARRVEKLQELEPALREAGAADVHSFELDVRDREAVNAALKALPAAWTEIEVLVNNAGLARGLHKLWEDDYRNWEEMIDTNMKGLLYVTRFVVGGMVARNRGHVISLGSIAGHYAYANGAVYCATKAGERFITDGLRIDLNGTNVRVSTVDPGMVKTDFSLVRFRGDDARAAKTYENVDPLLPEDVADVIAFVATRPAHVVLQEIVMTPVAQANPFHLTRKS